MTTILTILLWVAIALNVWLMIRTVKRERQCRKLLHERIEEFDEATELHITELQGAKLRVNEATAEVARIKKLYENLLDEYDEYEDMKLNYQRVVKERDDLIILRDANDKLNTEKKSLKSELKKLKEECEKKDAENDELRWRYNKLLDIKQPQDDTTGSCESIDEPKTDFKDDFDELRKSYEELAKSYNTISQKWENPSKTYLVNHIIKAYNVKSQTALAKALGVSKSAISRMIKK